jgi:RNA polymerase sigma factor (sigma-70 family)
MQELADTELLRQYADQNSEAAFAALVTRHVPLVYSAALRKTGNPSAAEEVTQAVFIILARKARGLRREIALAGWLYQATRLTAANFLRTEIRRARREQEAIMQSPSNETGPEIWPQIMPLLEDAIGRLGERDRNAVVLRFFEGKSFQEIGVAVGATENAAKKRVGHALEKLKRFYLQRGVDSTAAAIGETISANSIQAVPAALVKTATAAALAKGATASASTLILVKTTLTAMKTKTIIATVGAAVVIAGITAWLSSFHFVQQPDSAPANFTLPIQLPNAISRRDAKDLLFEIGPDPDTRRTSNSAPAIHIKGPIPPPPDLPANYSDAAQQKNGNSSSAFYSVTNGSPLLGKRIRITGWLKSSNVLDRAAAYFCIYDPVKGFVRLDTMDDWDDRPSLRGTMVWQQVEFVTDVPKDPCVIWTGPDLYGPGELWGDDFEIAFAPDAPITDDRRWRHTSETPDTYSETDDNTVTHNGHHTVCLAYTAKGPPRGGWMWWGQKIRPPDFEKYRGHSMRMSGWVKLENVSGRLQPCVRPWDKNSHWGQDSMSNDYSLKGTKDWTKFTVTGKIADDTAHIDTPFILWGSGKAWIDMDSLKFEVVN